VNGFKGRGKGLKLAISGKGGVGKTTIAAGLIDYFLTKGFRVYAVDADSDTSLGLVLGLEDEKVGELKPVVAMREAIASLSGGEGAFFSLNPDVDHLLDDYSIKKGNLLFLKMGAVKPGGTECYCRENTVLNALVNSLVLKREEIVVLDMGAGIEHLTRGTAKGVDLMLIVTEPSKTSLKTALIIEKLALELGIKNIKFICNRIRTSAEEDFIRQNLEGKDIVAFIPFGEQILEEAMETEENGLSFEAIPGIVPLAEEILLYSK